MYRQISTDTRHRWRLTKNYLTDPARSTVLVGVSFQSLDGRRHRVSIQADAAPSNETDLSPETCSRSGVLASDPQMAIALLGEPAVRIGACPAAGGIISTTVATALTGLRGHQQLSLALAFARDRTGALATARASLKASSGAAARYVTGWQRLSRLAAQAAPQPRHSHRAPGVR